jgi:tRNA pseudouridine13 synthase
MSRPEIDAAERALGEVRRDGLPNYFDDQRFGSLGASGEFVAQAWIRGDYERALWLALAEENSVDRSAERDEKRLLRKLWGDWPACKAQLGRSHRRSIVTYLCDRPHDFRGAVARIRVDLRSIYVSAFQSFLWNRLLAAWLHQKVRPEALTPVPLKLGLFPFFTVLDEETRAALQSTSLPLPSSRMRLDDGPVKQLVEASLSALGLTLREIRITYPRDSFFSKGWRAASFAAAELAWQTNDDELDAGKQKLSLRFDLPRGSYATILVKRITEAKTP